MKRPCLQGFWRSSVLGQLFLMALFLFAIQTRAFAEPDFLPPEQAFQFNSKQIAPDKVEVTFKIADGYYMYRERFNFDAIDATLGEITIPKGIIKFDETFQKEMETFRNAVTIQVQLASIDTSKATFTLITQSQGCSDEGLCYVPMDSRQSFATSQFAIGASGASDTSVPVSKGKPGDDEGYLQSSLHDGSLVIIAPLFLLLGLGLSFTPCVLPMVPILSSIIVGEGTAAGRHRGLILSLSYSFGMAIVYTLLGVAAGLAGEGLAAALQNPWVLGTFSLLLVGFALSMFNVYHFQVPTIWQSKLSHFSERHRSGKLLGVFLMGAISALIVGPCVAAPLASALVYISQTRDVLVGGTALFSMAMGMSVPLILVGISAGALLPRAGRWMDAVKQFFGVLILAMALWLISPVIPVWLHMVGWAALLIVYGLFLLRHPPLYAKAVALVLCTLGVIELVGAVTGGREILAPVAHLSGRPQTNHVQFTRIKSISELNNALEKAKLQNKPVMLDFYADWCVACKEMEKFTFVDERVQAKLNDMVLLQVDVTANNEDDRALLKRFNLYGPPGIIFFGLDSKESGRVIGFQKAEKFLQSLSKAMPANN